MTEEEILEFLRSLDGLQRGGPQPWINTQNAETMEDLGLIEIEGGGRYTITEAGRARLEAR